MDAKRDRKLVRRCVGENMGEVGGMKWEYILSYVNIYVHEILIKKNTQIKG